MTLREQLERSAPVRAAGDQHNRPPIIIEGRAPETLEEVPCIALTQIWAAPHETMAEPSQSGAYRMQLDAWAESAAGAERIVRAAEQALRKTGLVYRPPSRDTLMDGGACWRAGIDLTGTTANWRDI